MGATAVHHQAGGVVCAHTGTLSGPKAGKSVIGNNIEEPRQLIWAQEGKNSVMSHIGDLRKLVSLQQRTEDAHRAQGRGGRERNTAGQRTQCSDRQEVWS